MPSFSRSDLLARYRAMIARGEPIVGGGAGTGLSAKCEEAGGIDLIVIYNSGRFRMAGRGSLSGMMPYGDANAIVMDMAREVLPVVKHTPVIAGVCGTDPFRSMDVFLDEVKRIGFSGVQNFPTVGLIDGVFRQNLEETGMGYGLEVEMVALARHKGLLTTPYVFSEADAAAMAKAGADIIVCHLGLTTGGSIGAETALKLADCPAIVDRLGRGGAFGESGGHHPRAWRPGGRTAGCRFHHEEHAALPRLLRRLLDGAPAGGGGDPRSDAGIQDDRPQGRHRRKPGGDNPPFKRCPVRPGGGREKHDMTGQLIGTLILWLIVAVIVIAIIVYLVNWLYRRSSKEVSFVRTGLFGEKVVINGGAFVLPIIHDVTPVNMNVLRMAVTRANDEALITRDRMRVDIDAEFYVRVRPQREAVAIAAATLGRRTLQPDQLNTLLSGRLVSALRSIASEMTMEEMHEKRGIYVQRVKESAAEAFDQNGLELESVAITNLDQTDLQYFNPSNRFDAEGLTRIIGEIEEKRKLRNDIEQEAMIKIRTRNLEAERQSLDIERESESARLDQQREIEIRRAMQRAEVARERAARDTEAEQAQIQSREEIEKSRISNERAISEARIASDRDIRQKEIERTRAVEEAEIAARELVEKARIANEQAINAARIASERDIRQKEIERAKVIEAAEIAARESTDKARILQEAAVNAERIAREQEVRNREIERTRALEQEDIAAREAIEFGSHRAGGARACSPDRAQQGPRRRGDCRARGHRESAASPRTRRLPRNASLPNSRPRNWRSSARPTLEAEEIRKRDNVERQRIATELKLEQERIASTKTREMLQIDQKKTIEVAEEERAITLAAKKVERADADKTLRQAEIVAKQEIEKIDIAREQVLEAARVERRRALEQLEIARAQALQEAQITSNEEVERARISSDRGLDEARVGRQRDLRKLEIERERDVENAAMEKAIALHAKSLEESAAQVKAELARAKAVEAEELVQDCEGERRAPSAARRWK